MRTIASLSFVLIAGILPGFAADPQLLNMAMPEATTFGGINVEQARNSRFGQFLLSKIEVSPDFQKFIDTTGFDPRRDLREILVVATSSDTAGKPPVPTGILFLAKGTFDVEQILAAAAKDGHIKASTYAGASFLTLGGDKHQHAIGLIDGSTVVAGDVASVRGALDRRTQANSVSPALATRINELSTTQDAWSISNANFSNFVIPGPEAAGQGSAVLKGVQQASCGVKFGSEIIVNAEAVAKEAADATSLSDVIRFFAQMIQVQAQGDKVPVEARSVLKNLVVTTEGNVVKVTLSVPEDQIESLINSAPHRRSARI